MTSIFRNFLPFFCQAPSLLTSLLSFNNLYVCDHVIYYIQSINITTSGTLTLQSLYRWSRIIVGQVDLTAKLCLSICLELQSAKSTYQHVDLDL